MTIAVMADERKYRPCVFPGCDHDNGNPEITNRGMCDHCQRRYRRLLENLVLDWTILRRDMPPPARREQTVRTGSRVYGHPAEWASDLAADIAAKLNWAHDALAEHCVGEPPPHPGAQEATRIRAAWRYLECRIDRLATMPEAADTAAELYELHGKAKSGLGQTRPRIWLTGVPCMACNTAALTLIDGDRVECGECRETMSQDLFGLLARHAIDAAIDAYDAAHAP